MARCAENPRTWSVVPPKRRGNRKTTNLTTDECQLVKKPEQGGSLQGDDSWNSFQEDGSSGDRKGVQDETLPAQIRCVEVSIGSAGRDI